MSSSNRNGGANQCIESQQTLPARYNIAIDYTLLLIPILKTSYSLENFKDNFRAFFDEQTTMKNAITSAEEIFISLDYFHPAMKQDTCKRRKREYRKQQLQQQQYNYYHHQHYHHEHQQQQQQSLQETKSIPEVTAANPSTSHRTLIECPLTTILTGTAAATTTTTVTVANEVPVCQFLHLKDIRGYFKELFLQSYQQHATRPNVQISFNLYDSGEGEIKCFRYHEWQHRKLPTLIMSNDNDVLLIMLMHSAMHEKSERTKFYRLVMHTQQCGKPMRCTLQRISLHRLLQTEEGPAGVGWSSSPFTHEDAIAMRVNEHNAWILVGWLIALFGNDYVPAIRVANASMIRKWMCRMIRLFNRFTRNAQYIQLTAHNFFFVLSILFDVMNDNREYLDRYWYYGGDSLLASYEQDHDIPLPRPIGKIDEYYGLYTWCVRVYWNLLYLRDLPIAFTGTFVTDQHIPINLSIEKTIVDERTIRSLNQMSRKHIHDSFCFYRYTLRNQDEFSPANSLYRSN